jgi:hypothetical protein
VGWQACLPATGFLSDKPAVSRFRYVAPERLQFREGGGCLSLFGVPFFAAGIFLLLTAGDAIPMGGTEDLGSWGRPLLGLMGIVFTGVGGTLVLGRSWATLDVAERAATKSWGLLVPFKAHARHLDEFTRVTIGFETDSDSADHFPVTLKARSGPDLVLCKLTDYAEARHCAAEAARHLRFALEDASGDHAVAVDPAHVDRPIREHAPRQVHTSPAPPRPAAARSEVHHETVGVRIVIPQPRLSHLGLLFVLLPVAIPVVVVPWLWRFFQQTRTPEAVGVIFLGMFACLFGVLPAMTIVNGIMRARHGHLEVRVSREGVTLRERAAWRTRTLASLDAGDILDVDFGTRDSGAASARHAVEQKLMESGHEPASLSPHMEQLMAAATRWTKGRGVVVKSRSGLTSFGQDLDDDEIRYLHWVVRQALVAGARRAGM